MKNIWVEIRQQLNNLINSTTRTTNFVVFIYLIISSIFSTSANAIYQYIYTGNTLTNTYTGYSGGPPPDYTIIENFNNYISVSFLT